MGTQTVLITHRLRMRKWRREDTAIYARHCNTDAVMAWLGGVMTRKGVMLDVRYFKRQQVRNGFTFWVLEKKRDHEFLGFCGIVRVDEPNTPVFGDIEIGWRLRSDKWRRGYGKEAASAVLHYAFKQLELRRVVARVSPGNRASRGLMTALGMRRQRALDYIDPTDGTRLIVYGLTRSTWLKRTERQSSQAKT